MEQKLIANMAPIRPEFPKILLEASLKSIQDGIRSDEVTSKPAEKTGGIALGSSQDGSKPGRKKGKKDEDRRKRMQRKAEDEDDEPPRTYRNFDERRMGFLIIGDQHRLHGAAGGHDKFIFPTAPPVDFSYCMITKIEEIVTENESPQTKRGRSPKKTGDGRFRTSSLRLSYNVIDAVEGLINVLYKILDGGPLGLCWLDISFNALTKLDEDTFFQLPNLKILYLHGNAITDMLEVPNLMILKQLITLTLHGNPVEEETGYRIAVLYYLPWLTHLDFVAVTKADRAATAEFGAMYLPYWSKRHDALEAIYQTRKKAGEITYTERVMLGYEKDEVDDGEEEGDNI